MSKKPRSTKAFFAGKEKKKANVREEPEEQQETRLFGSKREALGLFQDPDFDVEQFLTAHFKSLTEKGINVARTELAGLLRYCTDEVQAVVYEHHGLFLQACEGIGELDDKVQLLRNCVQGIHATVQGLRQEYGPQLAPPPPPQQLLPRRPHSSDSEEEERAPPAAKPRLAMPQKDRGIEMGRVEQQVVMLLEQLDVAIAERDFAAVKELLAIGRAVLAVLDRDAEELRQETEDLAGWRLRVDAALAQRRQAMIKVTERILSQQSAHLGEAQAAARVLAELVGPSYAASCLLQSHSLRVRAKQAALLRLHSSGGSDPDGTEYSGGLVQHTFLAIGEAADSVAAVFGSSSSAVAALQAVWTAKEARQAAALVKRHALSPLAAPSGLGATVQCVALALVFASALEDSHGISVAQPFLAEVLPHTEGVLKRQLRRLMDELKTSVAEELSSMCLQCITQGPHAWGTAEDRKINLASAATLVSEVQAAATALLPVASPKLLAALRKGLQDLLAAFLAAVGSTVRRYMAADTTYVEKLKPFAEELLREMRDLAMHGLPEAVAQLAAVAGPLTDVQQLDACLAVLATDCGITA